MLREIRDGAARVVTGCWEWATTASIRCSTHTVCRGALPARPPPPLPRRSSSSRLPNSPRADRLDTNSLGVEDHHDLTYLTGLPPRPAVHRRSPWPPVRSLDAASHRPPDVVTLKPIRRISVSRALPPATVPRSRADTRKRGRRESTGAPERLLTSREQLERKMSGPERPEQAPGEIFSCTFTIESLAILHNSPCHSQISQRKPLIMKEGPEIKCNPTVLSQIAYNMHSLKQATK